MCLIVITYFFQCADSFCHKIVKELLHHTLNCSNHFCIYFTCAVAKRALRHWDTCDQPNCKICGPLRGTYSNSVHDFAECIRYQMLLFSHSDACLCSLSSAIEEDPLLVSVEFCYLQIIILVNIFFKFLLKIGRNNAFVQAEDRETDFNLI